MNINYLLTEIIFYFYEILKKIIYKMRQKIEFIEDACVPQFCCGRHYPKSSRYGRSRISHSLLAPIHVLMFQWSVYQTP